MVKIAHRFLLENSQNLRGSYRDRLVSHPIISYALSQDRCHGDTPGSHSWFLAHRREHALIELVVFFFHRYLFYNIFPFNSYSHALCHPFGTFSCVCVVLLRFLPCFIDMDFIDWQYGRRVERKNYYFCILDYSYAFHGI